MDTSHYIVCMQPFLDELDDLFDKKPDFHEFEDSLLISDGLKYLTEKKECSELWKRIVENIEALAQRHREMIVMLETPCMSSVRMLFRATFGECILDTFKDSDLKIYFSKGNFKLNLVFDYKKLKYKIMLPKEYEVLYCKNLGPVLGS